MSITWGETYDKGFVGFGLDYRKTHATYGSRPWMAECRKNYEIDSEGNYRTNDLYYVVTYGMKQTDCVPTALAGRTFVSSLRQEVFITRQDLVTVDGVTSQSLYLPTEGLELTLTEMVCRCVLL